MATPVALPPLGESVTEGTVTRWLKQVGDSVAVARAWASRASTDRSGVVTSSDPEVPSTPQLLTIDDLRRLFRCGRTTAYARVREPGFPAPLVLSGSAHRWWQHEVLAWLEGHRVQRSTRDASKPRGRGSSSDRKAASPVPRPVQLRRRNGLDESLDAAGRHPSR